ncbi:hypothetical protein UFOVP898_67 [uncultured Caudovirales phage]|uniref:Uncharacterized protein n=1 Tax=uncultured Caudovirales phage TaxID=2100421 RepID=A0A6J5QLF8_9CAUD|nr:hypothetical protein UFOVP898_67 [uncultured Caudovirales phage]CAB4176838.1 hypothetical protein UFOVP985_66 [uncultured Caudovirales phage]CAB4181818.1 hypothetical protein UFOVP1073_65 [uncultured Caudovirales phage]CAB4197753.1 hypothetical protein UFOVP1308_30 [uncultured Caudovirales phage]CAB4210690.1 hypothetical protein UFOVP1423_39 [uncultured Caudovirales phage]
MASKTKKNDATVASPSKAKASKAKAKSGSGIVVTDVTEMVMGALQKAERKTWPTLNEQATVEEITAPVVDAAPVKPKRVRKPKADAAPVVEAPVVVEEAPVVEEAAAEAMGLSTTVDAFPTEEAEARAAEAVYQYGEKLGIDIDEVVRISKVCGEYEMLKALAGLTGNEEIGERIVWLAKRKASDLDKRYVRPYRVKSGLSTDRSTAPKVSRAPKVNDDGTIREPSKSRCDVFGFSATAAIRALRATCGLTFAQIRNVLDALGAESVADATIRAQMAGGGTGRGEPAPLNGEQIAKAKELASQLAA